jgi:hypothetical protein
MNNDESQPDPLDDFEPWKAGESHDAFVQRAIAFEAKYGIWPPDPLLDEVAEMRRRVLAEHGNDYQNMLEWYVELGKQRVAHNGGSANGVASHSVARRDR